jgi:hypothetical protein
MLALPGAWAVIIVRAACLALLSGEPITLIAAVMLLLVLHSREHKPQTWVMGYHGRS